VFTKPGELEISGQGIGVCCCWSRSSQVWFLQNLVMLRRNGSKVGGCSVTSGIGRQANIDESAGTIHVDKVNMIAQKKKRADAASLDEMHK
jgi:hypothetical protein